VVVGSSSECWSFFYYYYFLRARATLILHTGTGGEKSVLSPLWFRQSVVEGRGAFDQKRQHDPPMVFLIQVLTLFALSFYFLADFPIIATVSLFRLVDFLL
jgi:hypothetical protein